MFQSLVFKLVSKTQPTLIPFLSSSLSSFRLPLSCIIKHKNVQAGRRSSVVRLFWAPVEVDSLLM